MPSAPYWYALFHMITNRQCGKTGSFGASFRIVPPFGPPYFLHC